MHKFRRVLDYMSGIDLDPEIALRVIGMSPQQLAAMNDNDCLPAIEYSRLYSAVVKQMQSLRCPIPWAAGIGSDAFELMCYSIITCNTLGEVLQRAQRFDDLLYPLLGYKMQVQFESDQFTLHYHVRTQSSQAVFAPDSWEWARHFDAVAHISGIMIWYKFCAWLIGKNFDLTAVHIAAPYVSDAYQSGQDKLFCCPFFYDAQASYLQASTAVLDQRIVHNPESLQRFLDNSIYELMGNDVRPQSTSSAIRSLVSRNIEEGFPSFKAMAGYLHCSESSLRRRLQKEDTSYQDIKDQLRCEFALDHLRNRDTRINDLVDMLGFAESSSFARSFRSWVGMTPSEYRDASGRAVG